MSRMGGMDSPSGRPSAGDAPRKQKPLRPVTIRQLLTAQRVGDGALVIDGQETGQVTIVGVVLGVEAADGANGTTQYTYKICDGSGMITVRTWTADKPAELHAYIRASGNVGSFQNNLSITGMIRVVNNCSEVPYHQMDCILTHLRITQGTRTALPPQQQQQQQQAYPQHAQQVYGVAAPVAPQAFSNPRETILAAVRQGGTKGASLQAIGDFVRPYGLQVADVRDWVRSLTVEGTLFTTGNAIFISQGVV